jgi:hypothetical protein
MSTAEATGPSPAALPPAGPALVAISGNTDASIEFPKERSDMFNPVVDCLDSLNWDGNPRLDRCPFPSKTNGAGTVVPADTMNIQDFLRRVLPWPDHQGAPGYGNIHWTFAPDDGGNPRWAGKPFRYAAEAASFVQWLKTKPSTRDIYFCLSLQSERKPGKKPESFAAIRKSGNALLLKSLWLDLDVKAAPKGYATLLEAAEAMAAFCKRTGMPAPSAVVRSGGGLHVYWFSKTPLGIEAWRRQAIGLKNAALQLGLRCDAGCTTDAARILRVPGTWNCKIEPWRPVQLVMAGDDYEF